ncbi:MAG: DUF3786 domain-containing protein [Bacillota bacterium]
MCSPVNAYQETLKRFVSVDPEEISARSGVFYNSELKIFEMEYFGSLYHIDLNGRVRRKGDQDYETPFNDRTLMLQYLCEASVVSPKGNWISFLELPDGAHHYVPLQTGAMNPMAAHFGNNSRGFVEAAGALGGRPLSLGDYSFYIPALPRVPLAVVLWEGDDEFPAKSNILYDATAPLHLTTAALWVLGVELAHKMIGHHNRDAGEEIAVTWLKGAGND